VHPHADLRWDGAQYVNLLGGAQLMGRSTDADKPAVALAVVRRWDTIADWPLDLRERVEEILRMIHQANDSG
jgi:hypothetical protein